MNLSEFFVNPIRPSWGAWNNKSPGQSIQVPNRGVGSRLQSVLDADIEAQLIDQGIDKLLNDYPGLIKDKKIKLHLLQMLIGKITSGEVSDQISLDNMIKKLKKRGIKVEIKKSQLKKLITEVLNEASSEKAQKIFNSKEWGIVVSLISDNKGANRMYIDNFKKLVKSVVD